MPLLRRFFESKGSLILTFVALFWRVIIPNFLGSSTQKRNGIHNLKIEWVRYPENGIELVNYAFDNLNTKRKPNPKLTQTQH